MEENKNNSGKRETTRTILTRNIQIGNTESDLI